MDYIDKLFAKDIGIFDNLEVQFSKKNNIIIGANSSGKTSILKLLAYCNSNNDFETTRFRKDAQFFLEFFHNEEKHTAGVQKIVDEDQQYRQNNIKYWNKVATENSYLPYEQSPLNLFAIGAYRYFEYSQIQGMKREEKGESRKNQYKNNNLNSLQKPSLPAIKQWMINRYFIVEKDWADVEKGNWEKLIDYLPNLVGRDQKFKFIKIERDLEPVFELNGAECYLEELSGGFKSVLSIIFSIIDWCEGTNEGKQGSILNSLGTVLIDEIEAHLHPEWQYNILSHLNNLFPNLQFIVTTHSPHVIANANNNEIIRIPAHNGSVNVKPLDKDFGLWQIKDVLDDLMGYNLNGNDISDLISKLDSALDEKDIEKYESYLINLKESLHPSDPIIKIYEINRSKIFLND
jgi:predicted ATP-binding protein involved in virulence